MFSQKKAKYPVAEPLYMLDPIYDDSVHDDKWSKQTESGQTQMEKQCC
jgi:hypothetical protein